MGASRTIALAAALLSLAGCQSEPSSPPEQADPISRVRIELDVNAPAKSTGILSGAGLNHAFHVGYGKYGIACEGSRFEEGVTPLGTFRINAVLSDDIFEMEPELIEQSGRTRDNLKSTLFRNMSAIDFKGDGETGEYGKGYISLMPLTETEQPFKFNEYDGKFRWYSFAIHGTNNNSRVGQKITGGCINVD
ncbi:MAG: L,D-transpeptidase, partial [Planctomycetaceae bacterium TMED241]